MSKIYEAFKAGRTIVNGYGNKVIDMYRFARREQPLIAMIEDEDGEVILEAFSDDGRWITGSNYPEDLRIQPQEHTRWIPVNQYGWGEVGAVVHCDTEEECRRRYPDYIPAKLTWTD